MVDFLLILSLTLSLLSFAKDRSFFAKLSTRAAANRSFRPTRRLARFWIFGFLC
jgi:hypothetical protein